MPSSLAAALMLLTHSSQANGRRKMGIIDCEKAVFEGTNYSVWISRRVHVSLL